MAKSLPDDLRIDYKMLHQSQLPLLQQLIKRVYANSRFYRDKLDAAGIKPEDISFYKF